MGRPWARSNSRLRWALRPRNVHCLMLRQRRWAKACAHDPGTPRAERGRQTPSPPGPESRQLLFHVTGKSSTATMFAFTVEAGATYKNNTVQGKMTGSWTLPEPLTELLSPIPLPLY